MRTSLLLFLALLLDLLCVVWLLDPGERSTAVAAAEPLGAVAAPAPRGGAPLVQAGSGPGGSAQPGTGAASPTGPAEADPAALARAERRAPASGWHTLAEMAESLARLDHPEGALEILEAAVDAALAGPADERLLFAIWLESNPALAALRADERFLGLLDRLVAPPFALA